MTVKSFILGAALAVLPALASAQMEADSAVARITSPLAQTGAVYLTLRNRGDVPDRLVRVEGAVADRVEIHSHSQDAEGVMRMVELEDGIAITGGEAHSLMPGGDHIMLLGLTTPLEQGDTFELQFHFDVGLPMTVTVTVDNAAVNALAAGAESEGMGHGDTHDAAHGTDG